MKQYLIGYDKTKTPNVTFFDIQDFESQDIRDMTVLTFTEDNIDYTYTGTNGVDFKEVSKSAPDFYYYEVIDEKECKKRGINTNPSQSSSTSGTSIKGTPVININNGIIVTLKSGKKVNILDPHDMQNLTAAEAKEVENELRKQLSSGTALGNALGQILSGPTGTGKKVKIDVDFSKDRNNPTVTFPDGSKYTLDDLQNMSIVDIYQIGEDNDIDISELISEINTNIFKGTTGKAKLNIAKLRTSGSTSSSSSSSGCGGGYYSGGCGGGYSSGGGCGGGYRSGC